MWRRADIKLGDQFAREGDSTIWKVVALIDRPVVVLRPDRRPGTVVGGDHDLHYVIDSPLFAEWKRVRLEGPES